MSPRSNYTESIGTPKCHGQEAHSQALEVLIHAEVRLRDVPIRADIWFVEHIELGAENNLL